MDPLTAIGLAGNILQFIDFTAKLLSQADEIRHAGSAASTFDLTNVTKDFETLTQKLTAAAPQNSTPIQLGQDDQALQDMSKECSNLARELSVGLNKISGKSGQSKWRTFRQVMRTIWTEKEISSLATRLDMYRNQMQFRMIIMLKKNIDLLTLAEQRRVSQAGTTDMVILNSIASNSDIITTNLYDTFLALRTRLDVSDARAVQRHAEMMARVHLPTTISTHPTRQITSPNQNTLPYNSGHIGSDYGHEHDEIHKVLLKSLNFERMVHREEDVMVAHPHTFHWALNDDWEARTEWDNFMTWLKQGEGCYWFSGKAGSGKSTLMKYILHDQRTEDALSEWADSDHQLIVGSFYFWRSGVDGLQKSQLGLFRTLLFQILKACPVLMGGLFPEWKASTLKALYASKSREDQLPATHQPRLHSPPDTDVKRAFRRLLKDESKVAHICLFIDGLDELEGDVEELTQLLMEARSPWIKIVASSRPIPECADAFQLCPRLRLQDLTKADMQIYVEDMLGKNSRMRELALEDATAVADIKHEIVTRSSGVFLWTVLVVKSLMMGLRNYDRIEELQRRLDHYPRDLDVLYKHMLKSINVYYREQASQLLQIAMASTLTFDSHNEERYGALTAVELYWSNMSDPRGAISASTKMATLTQLTTYTKTIERRLMSTCCGLLEIDSRQEVAFLHRTVLDFLQDPNIWHELLALNIDPQFDPNISLLSASLHLVKTTPPVLTRALYLQPTFIAARNCLEYCTLAENSAGRSQLPYIEELHKTMTKYWTQLAHPNPPFGERWTSTISPRLSDLFSVALFYDLVLSVKECLDTDWSRLIGQGERDPLDAVFDELVVRGRSANEDFEGNEHIKLKPPERSDSCLAILELLLNAGVVSNAEVNNFGSAPDLLQIVQGQLHPTVFERASQLMMGSGQEPRHERTKAKSITTQRFKAK